MKENILLPKTYAVLTENEMQYLDGGVVYGRIPVQKRFLNKASCLSTAACYAGLTLFDGKSYGQLRLAAEIYAHAFLYYAGQITQDALNGIKNQTGYTNPTINSWVDYILTHSNPIDLGGDSTIRVACYMAYWSLSA